MSHKPTFSPVTGYVPSGDAVDVIQFLAEKVFQYCLLWHFHKPPGETDYRKHCIQGVAHYWLTNWKYADTYTYVSVCVYIDVAKEPVLS